MKQKKITYGVSGMMEYVAVIKLGSKNRISVTFTDGSITAMGVTPATYTTDNLMVQHAIEHSPEYARGLIKTVREVELDTEVKIDCNASCCEAAPDVVDAGEQEVIEPEIETAENVAALEGGEANVEVEFSNNGDAKVYLEEKFGVAPSKLRTREVIESTALSYGVVIKWV